MPKHEIPVLYCDGEEKPLDTARQYPGESGGYAGDSPGLGSIVSFKTKVFCVGPGKSNRCTISLYAGKRPSRCSDLGRRSRQPLVSFDAVSIKTCCSDRWKLSPD